MPQDITFDTVQLKTIGPVGVLTLNRPEALNAFTLQMRDDVMAAFDQTDKNPQIRAVIVTGMGRAFCAGADLSSGAEAFKLALQDKSTGSLDDTDPKWRDSGGEMNLRIWDSQKPVIAAINGPAVGIGATMILPMDIRLAVPGAKMAYPFARRGIAWDGCASWFLPRVVGISQAMDWALSGRTFLSDEALEAGLIQELVDPDRLMDRALELAHQIADNAAPVSVAMMRRMAWRMLGAAHPMEAHRQESRAILRRGLSDDAREGVMSFLEKRSPDFAMKVPVDFPPGWPYDEDPDYTE